MYLSFAEYQSMGGTLDMATFQRYDFEAEMLINRSTFNRLKNDAVIPTEVKNLVLVLLDIIDKKHQTLSMGASSESSGGTYITKQVNDGVETTYNSMSAASLFQMCRNETRQAISLYLSDTVNAKGQRVLYRGLYPGE